MCKILPVLVISWCLGLVASAEETAGTNWLSMISSTNEGVRTAGEDIFRHERAKLIQALLKIVKMPVTMGDEYYVLSTPRNTAIIILGRMRAPEAISTLIEYVAPLKGEGFADPRGFAPAASALAMIGASAVEPVEKRLLADDVSSIEVRRQYLLILVRILGRDVTEYRLQMKLRIERNTKAKEILETCLRWLNDGSIINRGVTRPLESDEIP